VNWPLHASPGTCRGISSGSHTGLKTDLHIHTGDDPEDRVNYTSYELLDMAAEQDFDVISITNHNCITFDAEMRSYAEKLDILLIPGVEKTIDGKHVLIINPEPGDLEARVFGDLLYRSSPSKLIIAPHPFYPSSYSLKDSLTSHIGLFDAIEYSHYYTVSLNFNRKAVALSSSSSLPLVGTSDAHLRDQFGKTFTCIDADKSIDSVITAVRSGEVNVVSDPLSISQALKIRLSMSLL